MQDKLVKLIRKLHKSVTKRIAVGSNMPKHIKKRERGSGTA